LGKIYEKGEQKRTEDGQKRKKVKKIKGSKRVDK
jgi:hypothetical protein